MKYVVLIVSKYDYYNKYWVVRNTLEEARKVASEYMKDYKFNTEIYEIGSMLD